MLEITSELEERMVKTLASIWNLLAGNFEENPEAHQTTTVTVRRKEVVDLVQDNLDLGRSIDKEATEIFLKLKKPDREPILRQAFPDEWYGC